MIEVIKTIFLLAVIAAWLSPVAVGVFDIGCWIFTSAQCTNIDWGNPTRVILTMVWVVGGLFVVAFLGNILA